MRRNPDMVRDILLSVEANTDVKTAVTDDLDNLNYHVYLLVNGALLEGSENKEGRWFINTMTWQGCELLDKIRDDVRWAEIKRITDDVNCHSFWFIEQIADRLMGK